MMITFEWARTRYVTTAHLCENKRYNMLLFKFAFCIRCGWLVDFRGIIIIIMGHIIIIIKHFKDDFLGLSLI